METDYDTLNENNENYTDYPNDSGFGVIFEPDDLEDSTFVVFSEVDRIDVCISEEDSPIEKIVIPEGVWSIGPEAFSQYKKLKEVTLPKSLENLFPNSFDNFDMVIEQNSFLKVEDGILYNTANDIALCAVSKDRKTYSVKEGTVALGWGCFQGCRNVEKVSLPESLRTLGPGAFAFCDSLKELEIPSSLKSIGESAFFSSGIRELRVPSGCELQEHSLLNPPEDVRRIE